MITKPGIIFIIMLMVFGKVYAQNGNAVGKLIDKEKKTPVQNANVAVYQNKNIVYHTISDSAGRFKIPLNIFNQPGYVKISSLNYDDFRIDLKKVNDNNNSDIDIGSVQLTPRTIELKEVTINSKKRYRDTTKIDLSKQKFDRAIMIDDLFSGKFGFTKDEKGKLYYKGKLINDIVLNGGTFFGKNNMDIYQLLPALVLDNVEVTETNIDSLTNTTLQVPQLKVNLKLKEKYKKGILGNLNLGAGTASRYVANTGLYSYRNNEQISLSLNSNNLNIGDNTIIQPKVDFSANGNNSTTNTSMLTYRNVFAGKVEVNFVAKGKIENKTFTSETDRQEEDANIFSKTFNSTKSRSFGIEGSNFNIQYTIDTLNTIHITQTFDHLHIKQADSLNYFIKLDTAVTSSLLNKTNTTDNNLYSTEINYQKKFSSKKGRLLTFNTKFNNNAYAVNELDNVNSLDNQKQAKYFVNGNRQVNENNYTLNINYTEPLSDSCYINLFTIYQRNKLNYNPQINSDTVLTGSDVPAKINNDYFKPGISFQKIFNKFSLNAVATAIVEVRNINQSGILNTTSFLNLDINFNADFKLSKKKTLVVSYIAVTNDPSIEELVSLNSTFDLISRTTSNFFLKPEKKKSLKFDYSVRPSDSENIIVSGQVDHYSSTFGYNINNDVTSLQTIKTDNLGNSNGGQLSFTFLKIIAANKSINYTNSIIYRQTPTLINGQSQSNGGLTINQSFSTSLRVVDSLLNVTPIFTFAYSYYTYQNGGAKLLTLTYYDKLSLTLKGYEFNLYPLFNYNHSVTNTHSISMNGELRKSFLKKYLSVWVQAYDIFNSFKFYNNNVGASYYQSVKYSNVERYIIAGLSFKFNNIK